MKIRGILGRPFKRALVASRRRALKWARKRQGRDGVEATLESRRIYILPSGAGVVFSAVLFAMLLGAMNYSNNMGFALTFLLAGLGLAAMHQAHRNLHGVAVRFKSAEPVFAGQPLEYRFIVSAPDTESRWDLQLAWLDRNGVAHDLAAGDSTQVELPLETDRRGRAIAPPVRVRSSFPFGLFRAWAWLHMEAGSIVYPSPAESVTHRATSGNPVAGDGKPNKLGVEGFAGLRDYHPGDSTRRIAWKAYARADELLVAEAEDGEDPILWIDWDHFPDMDAESRLSAMTRLVLDANAAGRRYAVRMPAQTIEPGEGTQHRTNCLTALALHGNPEPLDEFDA